MHDSAVAAIDEKLNVRRQWRNDRIQAHEAVERELHRHRQGIQDMDDEIAALETARAKLVSDPAPFSDVIAKVAE